MSERSGAALADNNTKTTGNGEVAARARTPLAERERPESTRATYARAMRGVDDWLAGRPLDDSSLSAYLDHMYERGLSPKYAGVVVAAAADRARNDHAPSPVGELTNRALVAFRRDGAGRGTGQVDGIGWPDAKRMAKLAAARGDLAGLRDALYIRIVSACLLRVSEAAALDIEDMSIAAAPPTPSTGSTRTCCAAS